MREWDWWVGSATLQRTDDAYLQADTTPLAAKVPGYVSRVLVEDFQRVHGGDVLVEIVDDARGSRSPMSWRKVRRSCLRPEARNAKSA